MPGQPPRPFPSPGPAPDGATVPAPRWPIDGGRCGALIRRHDWAASPLGPIEDWPAELRSTVQTVLASSIPQVLMWGEDHVMLYNDGYGVIAGDKHPQAQGGPVRMVWPELWEWNRAILDAGFRGETLAYRDQALVLHRHGRPEPMIFDLFYTPVRLADGGVGGVLCSVIDSTERVAARRSLAASAAELRALTDALPMLISYVDRDETYRFVNQYYERWLALPGSEIVGHRVRDVLGPETYALREPLITRALAGEAISADGLLPQRDGSRRRAEIRYLPRIDGDGQVDGFHVLAIDIEERAQREQDLAISNARFRAAMDAVHGVLWTNNANGRMEGPQPGWAAMTGQAEPDYQGYGWTVAIHPDDLPSTLAAWNAAQESKSPAIFEHRVRVGDGSWRNYLVRAVPTLDADGAITDWVGVHTDITEQRAAEAQLRQLNETLEARVIAEIGERRQAEAALAQAQKMEAIGKLTGGVAHDFNNLLQVVSGNLQLLAGDVADNPRGTRRVTNAMAGVQRGAKLAAQLLAFGRRQALEPKVVNVTRFVQGMDDMLRRAIGETIAIETICGAGLWSTFVDPAQVENALLNLAINARDAMGGQGRLTIELANAELDAAYASRHDEVQPGEYVMMAVSDTGSGMTPDIMAKAFEPFFSTKSEGKGSGLGLSMVYGFVRQSGGHVKIYSEPGHGTTIRLYLPRATQAEDIEVAALPQIVTGGSETILVVEDDAEVRATVVELLSELGYTVLQAGDADAALVVIESGAAIDLLFTDVVMPGTLKSPELARRARARLPGIAVLFTSGYTQNSIVHGGRLDAGVELLSKPYTREALALKLRQVIGARAARPSVLLVEDNESVRSVSAEMLREAGHEVFEAADADTALAVLADRAVAVLVTDLNLPGRSGGDLAVRARALHSAIGVVFATGDPDAVDGPPIPGALVLAKPYPAGALIAAIAGVSG